MSNRIRGMHECIPKLAKTPNTPYCHFNAVIDQGLADSLTLLNAIFQNSKAPSWPRACTKTAGLNSLTLQATSGGSKEVIYLASAKWTYVDEFILFRFHRFTCHRSSFTRCSQYGSICRETYSACHPLWANRDRSEGFKNAYPYHQFL